MLRLFVISAFVTNLAFADRVQHGIVVPPSERPEVGQLETNSTICSATVVGPRTILTTAACAYSGSGEITLPSGKFRVELHKSPLYDYLHADSTHDLAVGIASEDLKVKKPAVVTGKNAVGTVLTFLGYGCEDVESMKGIGTLRKGTAVISKFAGFQAVTDHTSDTLGCWGDAGGPGYVPAPPIRVGAPPRYLLSAVNSAFWITHTNFFTRLDAKESREFLSAAAKEHGAQICGINLACQP